MKHALRAYRLLLLAYPRPFRRLFARDMTDLFADRWRAERQGRAPARLRFWLRTIGDVVASAAAERRVAYRGAAAGGGPAVILSGTTTGTPAGGALIMETIWQDVRYAARSLVRRPAFTIVAVLTLALGIGANTAIFTVINAVLLRPLPYAGADRLVKINGARPDEPNVYRNLSRPDFLDFARESRLLDLGAHGAGISSTTVTGNGDPERARSSVVSAGLFRVLQTTPQLGRLFRDEENVETPPRVVVISHQFWQRRLSGDAAVIGRSLTLSGNAYEIVGVLPAAFEFPQPDGLGEPSVYFPMAFGPDFGRSGRSSRAIARLKDGASLEQARAELDAIAARLEQQYPTTNFKQGVAIRPLKDAIVGDVRAALVVLGGAVGLVLLIACANLANLLLAHGAARRRELAIRTALGAARFRLARQLLTESVLLALGGGLAGFALAFWSLGVLVDLGDQAIPRSHEIALDLRMLIFTIGLAAIAGVVFGLLPAWQAARADVGPGLAESGRGHSGGRARQRVRSLLVTAEVALSLVLLMGAALLVKSLWRLTLVNPGIQTEDVLSLQIALPLARYPEGDQIPFYERLYARVAALPGVQSVGATNILPLTSNYSCDGFQIEGRLLPEGQNPCAETRSVSTGYFETMGIPMVGGRTFLPSDTQAAPKVAVISRTMAERHWPNENPIGRRLIYGRGLEPNADGARVIVGVVGDVRHFGPAREPFPELYTPQAQQPSYHEMTVVVRSADGLDPSSLVSGVRGELQAMDPLLPLSSVRTLDALARASVAQPRFRTVLLTLLAGLALVLAVIGVYGVIAYAVSQRTQEIGIRMALGAHARDVIRLLLRQGMTPVFTGIAAGLAGALVLGRALQNLLFDVDPHDPLVFLAVPVLLALAAAAATILPVRRAVRIDPLIAMRID